jgi:homoserine kinase type II
MAVFTSVTPEDLSVWLNDYSIGNLIELKGIASGIENTNYFVTTDGGRFVLTMFEKLTADELPFYLNLMAHLAAHDIPCPAPRADRHGNFLGSLKSKPACIVSRLPGASLTQPDAGHCAAVGAMLGKMHRAGQGFTGFMPNARGIGWRANAAREVTRFLSTEDAALLENEVRFHATRTLASLPQGVIHADLFRDNVLFDGARVGGLIDFYFACNDSLLYDVAITVNDWCMGADGTLDAARAQALLRAYHAERPLLAAERDAWPVALRAAALRFWLSRLYDLHLPRDGEMVHTHDPEQFKRILRQHIAAGETVVWV